MRVDSIGPLGWLLGAVAAWALLVGGLALFGLGGRIQPLPDDPSLLPALPALPATGESRLGEAGQYAMISTRPVFSENRQPQSFVLTGNAVTAPVRVDVTLTSVLITPQMNMAILRIGDGQSLRLRQGDDTAASGWRLLSVEPRGAVVEGPNGIQNLELRVYDGSGGEMPAPSASRLNPALAPGAPRQAAVPGAGAKEAVPAAPVNGQAPHSAEPAVSASAPPATSAQQMEDIRQRIQARRQQLQQQQQSPAVPSGQKP